MTRRTGCEPSGGRGLPRARAIAGWLGGGVLCAALAAPWAYPALAAPLVRSTPVTGADAIVVLGGGVTRRGEPTPSTRERVLYGVGLYREEFAPLLVLSTGAPNGISEARAMERLALAEGVPPRAILLEEDSRNTQENLRCVHRLLRERGLRRFIIVSSPYHMGRVALVQDRLGKGTQALYAPVRPSHFYRPSNLKDRFWKSWAVVHEYAGIAWYWLVVK